jgi:hypothetical protein
LHGQGKYEMMDRQFAPRTAKQTELRTIRLMKLRALLIALALLGAGSFPPIFAQPNEPQQTQAQAPRKSEPPIVELKRHLQELVEASRMEEAAQVKKKLAELQKERARPSPEADMEQRRARLQKEIARLRRQGHHEEAEHLEREPFGQPERARDRERQIHREHAGTEARGDMPELHRRLHHLQVAIENLRMAGYPEPAERLEREAQNLTREIHKHPGRDHEPERPPHPPGGADEDARQAIHELRRSMDELRRGLERVHEEMRHIQNRPERRVEEEERREER